MEKEIWKCISGYESRYEISNLGKVKRLERSFYDKIGRLQVKKEYILKLTVSATGYFIVNLTNDLRSKTYHVHQLVAMAFLNHVPNKYISIIDHIDDDKLNNIMTNLRIVSPRINTSKGTLNKTGYQGVTQVISKYNGKVYYSVKIRILKKRKYLGIFSCLQQASEVYQNAVKELEA
jgi:hypothetical protein